MQNLHQSVPVILQFFVQVCKLWDFTSSQDASLVWIWLIEMCKMKNRQFSNSNLSIRKNLTYHKELFFIQVKEKFIVIFFQMSALEQLKILLLMQKMAIITMLYSTESSKVSWFKLEIHKVMVLGVSQYGVKNFQMKYTLNWSMTNHLPYLWLIVGLIQMLHNFL
jgi:hypothetical protein